MASVPSAPVGPLGAFGSPVPVTLGCSVSQRAQRGVAREPPPAGVGRRVCTAAGRPSPPGHFSGDRPPLESPGRADPRTSWPLPRLPVLRPKGLLAPEMLERCTSLSCSKFQQHVSRQCCGINDRYQREN